MVKKRVKKSVKKLVKRKVSKKVLKKSISKPTGRKSSNKSKATKVMKLRTLALQKTVKKEPKKWSFSLFKPKVK